jgi:hypothetical protein
MASMSTSRLFPAAATVGNQIYVMAGVTPDEAGWKQFNIRLMWVNSTEIYDPVENKWSPGPNLCSERQNPTAANFLDTLYVVGGYCRDPLDSVERLPIESLEEETVGKDKHGRRSSASALWQCSTPLPEKRDACRVVVLL